VVSKSAGIRTFALISLAAAVFSLLGHDGLLIVGGALIVAIAVLLAVRSFVEEAVDGLSLTTSVSMLVTYGVGALVVEEFFIEAVTVAMLSSLLLVLKRELHQFAWGLSREEVRSAVEFTIIAFVVSSPAAPGGDHRPVGRGPAASHLVAGRRRQRHRLRQLRACKAVPGARLRGHRLLRWARELDRGRRRDGQTREGGRTDLLDIAVGSILLANAAMALRNAAVVAVFVPEAALIVGAPLGAITVAGILIAVWRSDWQTTMEAELTSPFSLRNALTFGALFLLVLVVSAGAERTFGAGGFVATSFLAGLVSSGTATTTAVSLLGTGQISVDTAVAGSSRGRSRASSSRRRSPRASRENWSGRCCSGTSC